MDITNEYRQIVSLVLDKPVRAPAMNRPVPDAMTELVYKISSQITRIHNDIKTIRPKYLTLSGSNKMLDSEKDDFDNTVRNLIEKEKLKIDQLEKQENERQQQQSKKGLAAMLFSDPDADALSETLHLHRQGMFHYLTLQLQSASAELWDLQRIRYARSVNQRISHTAKPKKVQSSEEKKVQLPGSLDSTYLQSNPVNLFKQQQQLQQQQNQYNSNISENHTSSYENERDLESSNYTEDIPESQYLLLQEEHDELVDSLNTSLKEAEKAEESLRQISVLQSELNQHLSSQSLTLESLQSDALRVTKEISGANKYLEQAKKSNRFASRCVIAVSITVGVMLLLANGK